MSERIILSKEGFNYGQIHEHFASEPSSKAFQRGCIKAENGYIKQQGSFAKRPGSKFLRTLNIGINLATGQNKTIRTFRYRSPTDTNYLVIIQEGQNYPYLFNLETSEVEENFPRYSIRVNQPYTDTSVRVITDPYVYRPVAGGFTKKQVEDMHFASKENLMCFTVNSIPPFFIVEDLDENKFYTISSLLRLSYYYNSRQTNLLNQLDSEVYYRRMFQSYPYEFLPFGFYLNSPSEGVIGADTEDNPIRDLFVRWNLALGNNEIPVYDEDGDFPADQASRNRIYNKLLIAIDLSLATSNDGILSSADPIKYNYIYLPRSSMTEVDHIENDDAVTLPRQRFFRFYSRPPKPGIPPLTLTALFYRFRREIVTDDDGRKFGGITSASFFTNTDPITPSSTSLYVTEWADGDYPSTCSFYERRLILGSTRKSPQKIWFSEVNAESKFFDFDQYISGVRALNSASPGSFELSSNRSFSIKRIGGLQNLYIATDDIFFSSQGTDVRSSVPLSTGFVSNFSQPASNIEMQTSDNYIFFFSENRQKLFRVVYSREAQKFVKEDVTIFLPNLKDKALELGAKNLVFREGGFDPSNKVSVFQYSEFLFLIFTYEESTDTRAWTINYFLDEEGNPLEILDITPYQDEEIKFIFSIRKGETVELREMNFNIDPEEKYNYAISKPPAFLDNFIEYDRVEEGDGQELDDEGFLGRVENNLTSHGFSTTQTVVAGGVNLSKIDFSNSEHARRLNGFRHIVVGQTYNTILSPVTPNGRLRRGTILRAVKKFNKISIDILLGAYYILTSSDKKIRGRKTELLKIEEDKVTLTKNKTIYENIAMPNNRRDYIQIESEAPYPLEISGITFEGDVEA